MLPLPLQFVIAMIAQAINERMARQLDYLMEEVRVLREVYTTDTGRKRIPFTDEQRRRLAVAGQALTPEERETCCQLIRPRTILEWFRQLTAKRYDGSKQRRKPGRPRKADEIRALVVRLANENVTWGYTKIRDAMRGLKIDIGRTTVVNILAEAGVEPAPERTQPSRATTMGRMGASSVGRAAAGCSTSTSGRLREMAPRVSGHYGCARELGGAGVRWRCPRQAGG
jgi:putative transposase